MVRGRKQQPPLKFWQQSPLQKGAKASKLVQYFQSLLFTNERTGVHSLVN